jgi:hypothetical protein
MRNALVAISLLALPLSAPAQQAPGYGVVESVTPISRTLEPAPGDQSASAGGSRPPMTKQAREKRGYLVRVRMDDGSVQVRSVKRAEVRPGQRALVTNAGDVVPE